MKEIDLRSAQYLTSLLREIKENIKDGFYDKALCFSDKLLDKLSECENESEVDDLKKSGEDLKLISKEKILDKLSKGEIFNHIYFHRYYSEKNIPFTEKELSYFDSIGFGGLNHNNINLKKKDGNNILMEVCNGLFTSFGEAYNLNLSILDKILSNYTFDLNSTNNNGSTVLSNIIQIGGINILKYISYSRSDLDTDKFESIFGDTYIQLANGYGHTEIEYFLENR